MIGKNTAPIKNATIIPIIATLRFNAEFPFPEHTGGVEKASHVV